MEYRYWLVRFVGNLAREEFVNVGVVCGADELDWAVRFDYHEGDPCVESRTLRSWADWFQRRLATLETAMVNSESTP